MRVCLESFEGDGLGRELSTKVDDDGDSSAKTHNQS
jgi:hypothetical protein